MNAPAYNFAYLDEQTKRMIRRAILKAVAIPGYQVPFASREMPMPYGWGTGGVQVTASILGPDDVLKVIDQGSDDTTNAVSIRQVLRQDRRRAHHHAHGGGDRHPDAPPHSGSAARRGPDPGLPGADPRAAALPRAARDRDAPHARARRIRPDACEALRGHRAPRPHRDHLRLSGEGRRPLRDGPVADAEIRQSEDERLRRRCSCSAPAARSASTRSRRTPAWSRSISRTIRSSAYRHDAPCALCGADDSYPRRGRSPTTAAGACSSAPTPTTARAPRAGHRGRAHDAAPERSAGARAWLSLVDRAARDRADLPAVLALYAQPDLDDGVVLSDRRGAKRSSRASPPIPTTRSTSPSSDGAVVGTFALLIMDNLGHLGAPSAMVEDVAVAPAAAGPRHRPGDDALRPRPCREARAATRSVLSSNVKRERAHAFYERSASRATATASDRPRGRMAA